MKRRKFLSLMGTTALAGGLLLTGCGGSAGAGTDHRKIIRIEDYLRDRYLARPMPSLAVAVWMVPANDPTPPTGSARTTGRAPSGRATGPPGRSSPAWPIPPGRAWRSPASCRCSWP